MKNRFLSFLALASLIILGSCSKSRDLSCPSFKEKRNYDLSLDLFKKKQNESDARNAALWNARNASITAFEARVEEAQPLESIHVKASMLNLTASAAALDVPTPSVTYRQPSEIGIPNEVKADFKPKLGIKERIALYAFEKSLRYENQKMQKAAKSEKTPSDDDAPAAGKSQLVALLLCIFLGGLGIHRFYLGYTTIGIIQLFTAGGCGVWALIDLIRIITGDLKPKNGDYTETL